jgi:hypothetical protein
MKYLTETVLLIIGGLVFANNIIGQDEPPPIAPNAVRMPSGSGKDQPLKNGVKLLKQVNLAHGGAILNNVKTLRLKGRGHLIRISKNDLTTNLYYNLTVLIDLERNFIRKEEDAGEVHFEIRQTDGKSGWVFNPKQSRSISESEQNALLKILESSPLGFRKNSLSEIKLLKLATHEKLKFKYLVAERNDVKHLFGFDKNSRLLIDDYFENGEQHEITFDDFRKINGIVFPFFERFVIRNVESRTVKYWSIEVNPKLTEKDWSVPK